jgi:putative Mn2+ efflux pump MntP
VLGEAATQYIADWNHWIASVFLSVLGLRMIREGAAPEVEEEKPSSHSFWRLGVTGFATSIDAMAVGVRLAFIDANIMLTVLAIGLATFAMVALGIMMGRLLGSANQLRRRSAKSGPLSEVGQYRRGRCYHLAL